MIFYLNKISPQNLTLAIVSYLLCEFVIHSLSKCIWSREYMQGKIKKEAAIACAASAIRVCALITHLVLTLLRECNGPQIID